MSARVLVVVEDDLEMRNLVKFLLESESGLEIIGEVASGEEAIRLAKDVQPDLVILDHFIEGEVMGLELSRELKEVAPKMKIVLFSSHNLKIEAEREPAIDLFVHKNEMHELPRIVKGLLAA